MPAAAPVEETITTLDLTTRDQEAEPCSNQNCGSAAEFVVILIPSCDHVHLRHPFCGPCKNAMVEQDRDPFTDWACRKCEAVVKIKSVWKIR